MPKWLFTSGTTRGSFLAVEPDGDRREVVGIDMVLGIGEGQDVKTALESVISKLVKSTEVPEYLYKERKVVAYPFEESIWVPIGKIEDIESDNEDEPKKDAQSTIYEMTLCKWCQAQVPSNGGAQYAHLQKHLRQAVKAGKITQEQVSTVKGTNLGPELEKIFMENKSVFNES